MTREGARADVSDQVHPAPHSADLAAGCARRRLSRGHVDGRASFAPIGLTYLGGPGTLPGRFYRFCLRSHANACCILVPPMMLG